jgi:fibronectin type 3 domain-containing protein
MKPETDMKSCAGHQAKSIQIRFIRTAIVCMLFCSITPLYAVTPWLHTDANKIKDPAGNVVVLRGVDTIDLGSVEMWRDGGVIGLIDRVTDKNNTEGNSPGWYPRVIRLAVYPQDEGDTSSPWYWEPDHDHYYNDLLRPVVDYCRTKDLYAIIDWHYVGDDTGTKVPQTSAFWTYMAPKFANDSHVLFELFNEPLNTSGSTDALDWASCKTDMQTWINIVRTYAPNNLILVAGPSWSQEIGPAADNPFPPENPNNTNIVMVAHTYPGHWHSSNQSWYLNHIDHCLTRYPVFMSEWGFRGSLSGNLQGTIADYGQPLSDWREARKISNSAWVTDYSWQPEMFNSSWNLLVGPGEMGGFTKDLLYAYRNSDQPGGGDTMPPAAPADLVATAGDSVVWLDWDDNNEIDLDGYNVYRSTTSGSGYSKLNSSLVVSSDYTDNGASGGRTYYYIVTAVDTSWNESNDSNEVFATPIDTIPPLAPTDLSATAGDRTVSLNWNDNSESDLDGYNVYRSMTSGSGYVQINGSLLSVSNYADNSVANGTTYYYVVTAVDILSNESNDSNEVSAMPELRTDVEVIGSWATGTTHAKESGTSRALVLIVHAEHDEATSITAVTYGGQPMTKINDIIVGTGWRAYVAAYTLDEAGVAAASSGNFNVTWSTTPDFVAYSSVFLQNVNQTALIGAYASSSTAGSTPNPITTSALATNNGDMVVLGATCGNSGSYTLQNSFIEGNDQSFGSTATGVSGYKAATGAAETPSAQHNNPNRQVIIGFVVQAAAGEWLYGDLTGDNKVDMNDLHEFSLVWLVEDCENNNILELDLDDDCVINFYEYSFFAQNWLEEI